MSAPRRTLLIAVLAVLGIAVAAAITWGTSQLVRQHIGLASEPLTAGRQLLPRVTSSPAHVAPRAQPAPTSTARTNTEPSPPPATATSPPASANPPSSGSPPTTATEPPSEPQPPARGRAQEHEDVSPHRDD